MSRIHAFFLAHLLEYGINYRTYALAMWAAASKVLKERQRVPTEEINKHNYEVCRNSFEA